jgi:transcriptional regulator with XRE-family HTH domain/ribosome-binding protein aMBF1 (putative translation factor)
VERPYQRGTATWDPPRGPRPAPGEKWPLLAKRLRSRRPDDENPVVDAHEKLLNALDAARRCEDWSQVEWAQKSRLRLSVLSAAITGSVWPDFATLHAMADSTGNTLVVRATNRATPQSSGRRKPPVSEDDFDRLHQAAVVGGRDERGRFAHDLICWNLTHWRKNDRLTVPKLASRVRVSANTISRLSAGPATGRVVSYLTMLVTSEALGARIGLAAWDEPPYRAWQSSVVEAPAESESQGSSEAWSLARANAERLDELSPPERWLDGPPRFL